MEDDLCLNLHSDPHPLTAELTRTNSESSSSSSSITVDTSKDISLPPFSPGQLTKWTDQQHSSYLQSLEASFVNELHSSMRLRGWRLQNNSREAYESRVLRNSFNMSRQFMVLQDGLWKKISLGKNDPVLESTADESTADSHVLAGSPMRHHLTLVKRDHCTLRESNFHDHGSPCNKAVHVNGSSTTRSSEKPSVCHSCHPELVGSTVEITDQNFKNEEQGSRSSCVPNAKRLKTTTTENDQVVPLGKFHSTNVSTTSPSSSSENKGQIELLSELPESFHFPKSDLHYFLRGS